MECVPAGGVPFQNCLVCRSSDIKDYCAVFDRLRDRPDETWQIEYCRHCGFGWTAPMPAPEQIASLYPPAYLGDTPKTLDAFLSGRLQRSRSWRGEIEKVRLVERFVSSGKILDVGCGDGKFLWALDPGRWKRTGVDSSSRTLELVRACIPEIPLVAGDIHSTELIEGEFDVVTFWHVLEHLPDPRKVIARASSLLKDRGWLFVSLPNLASLQARVFRRHWYAFDDVPRHLYHFSRLSLDLLLHESGLTARCHLLFSRHVNSHCLKHSLLNWCGERFGSRIPYYALKPLLAVFPLLERLTGQPGILTVVAQKPGDSSPGRG